MIKHTVCFKLDEPTPELIEKTREILLSMEGRVPQIKAISVGADILHTPRSYDVILEVVVENMAEYERYQRDEYHCSVVKPHMHSIASKSVAVDCEI